MHKIESLDIFGFKSFCEKTNVVFNGDVTAIIGPNGCGKSNLSDAVNWVLGEQSSKSLRADRMEDVIFNGTQKRKPLSAAEVTLTLKDFMHADASNGDENIIISRRVYRSGESEYFLNGRRCRLKDIHEFFEGTGLGGVSYALIEQGKIDMILSAKPQDRRTVIEEAAKIVLFKSKRKASEIKLELARQNLARVHDIIQEVDRQLAALKRQAAKARRYYRLLDEVKYFSHIKYAVHYQQLTSGLTDCQSRHDEIRRQEKSLMSELHATESAKKQVTESATKTEHEIELNRDRLGSLQIEASEAQNKRTQQEEQVQFSRKQLAEKNRFLVEVNERLATVRQQKTEVQNDLTTYESEMADKEAAIRPLRETHTSINAAIDSLEKELQLVRSFSLTDIENLAAMKNKQARLQEDLDRHLTQLNGLNAERDALLQELWERERQAGELQEAVNVNQTQSNDLKDKLDKEDARTHVLRRLASEKEAELHAAVESFNLLQNRHATLEEIDQKRTNYSESVQRFLSSAPTAEMRVLGTLADFINADPKFETAVEDFLENQLQFVVVEGLEDALKALPFLRTNQSGRCTFMVLEAAHDKTARPERSGRSTHESAGLAFLQDILSIDPRVKDVFLRVLPELDNVVLVEDLETALNYGSRYPDLIFLTPSGEVYFGRGLVSGTGEKKSSVGLLSLRRERKELAAKMEGSRAALEMTRNAVEEIRSELEANFRLRQTLADQRRTLDVEGASLKLRLTQTWDDSERLSKARDVIDQQISLAFEQKGRILEEQESLMQSIQARESDAALNKNKLTAGETELIRLKEEREQLQNTLTDVRLELAGKYERGRALEEDCKRLSQEEIEIIERERITKSETKDIEDHIESLIRSDEDLEIKIKLLAANKNALQEELRSSQQLLAEFKAQITSAEENLTITREKWQQTLEARSKIEIEKTRLESDLQHLAQQCQEEFHCTLEAVLEGLTEEQRQYDTVLAAQNHERVKEQLEHFGAINMHALEEYEQLEARYQFLLSQEKDIQDSIASIQEAIEEINRRSTEQFRDAFEKINLNFQQIFETLFSGGHCEMKLLDETDILESGIEIIAQPPGKKLQNVLLLSGGEKALTTLALLLAIFKFRPSPFCVLDEVDAPLDDANILRFTKLIEEMSRETQFILITHNKRTMEVAQTLYGVTMEEPGVSKLVSVRFGEQQAQPPRSFAATS